MISLSIIVVLSILIILLFLISRAQYKRAQKYEKMIVDFGNNAYKTYELMKEIDDKQWFEKDDEVGVLFSQIVEVIEDFNKKTQSNISE